jgi:predicted outer membrane protein
MRIVYGCSFAAVLAFTGLAVAQNREANDPARPAAGARPAVKATTEVRGPSADQQIASLLHSCCKNNVEISKFVQDKLQSDSAKQFAEKMVAEHSEACTKLAKFAGTSLEGDTRLEIVPGANREAREERREGRENAREAVRDERRDEGRPEAREERREGRENAREERREDADDAPRPARAAARALEGQIELKAGGDRTKPEIDVKFGRSGAGGNLDWVSIHKQIADQCLASTKEAFGAKEGPELDRCYLGGQIMAHMKALDEIKVLRKYVSAEFQQELDACAEGCKAHLEEAKTLAKQLEGGDAPRVSRKPDETTETTKPE